MASVLEQYQVAGFDERERGFNRQIDMERVDGGIRAVLRYEKTLVETRPCETSPAALDELIRLLRERGYSQLRSRLNFRGGTYLGNQEPWVEYPDPDGGPVTIPADDEQSARRSGWIGKALSLFVKR